MLDRMSLSVKNGWFDEDGRAYIYFTISDISEQLSCGSEKANKMLFELDDEKGCGLIERKKQGQGNPTVIYLKKFITNVSRKTELQTTENRNSEMSEIENQDFGKSTSNKTYINKKDFNNTDINTSYPIGKPDGMDWI